ncbi:unnamed protein product [Alopecurus aequalis]
MGRRRPKKRTPPGNVNSSLALSEHKASQDFIFPVGAEVEVRSDDPGFQGAFYEATVAGHLTSSGANRYTLAYSTPLAHDGAPLKETAAAADVRPRPPPPEENAAPTEFAIYDMVEAFHNDGWRAGVVSAVPATGDRRRRGVCKYSVMFPTSRETTEFEETALRPHRVFRDGRWVPAAEMVHNVRPFFTEGNQVEVSLCAKNIGQSWIPATVLKVIGATNVLVQYMHIEKNGELTTEIVHSRYIRPARIITGVGSRHRFSPSSHVEVFHQGSWQPGVIVEVLGSEIDNKYVVKLKNHERDAIDVDCAGVLTVENTQLRPRYDWNGKKWVRYLKEKPPKVPRKRRTSSVLALYDDGDEFKPGSCHEKKLKKADVVSESISLILPEKPMEKQNAVLALGSPLPLTSLPPKAALGHLSSSSLAKSCHLEKSSQMTIVPYMPHGPCLGTRSRDSDWSNIVVTDKDKQLTVGSRTDLSRQKGECVAFETPEAARERTKSAKKGIAAKTIEEDDDITVSQLPNDMTAGCKILPEMHTGNCIGLRLTACHEIRCSKESPTKEFSDSGQSIEKSTVTQISSVGVSNCTETEPEPGNSMALAIQDLPIVKTFPLWAELEAREIFRNVPQRPHFQLLQHHCPEIREGMAFGLMLSFVNLAESINRLEVQDENGLLEEKEKMLVLSLLEANGFDVRELKSRLEPLVDAKNRHVELQDAMSRLEEIISKKETVDRQLSTQIRMIAVALHHLELNAYLIRNEMWSTFSQRMNNAMEISGLKAQATELERSYVPSAIAAPR